MTISETSAVTVAALASQNISGRRVGTTCGTYAVIRFLYPCNLWLKTDHRIRTTFDVQRVDKPNVARLRRHHDRMRPLARSEKPHTLQ